jgi:hypothetical protein
MQANPNYNKKQPITAINSKLVLNILRSRVGDIHMWNSVTGGVLQEVTATTV